MPSRWRRRRPSVPLACAPCWRRTAPSVAWAQACDGDGHGASVAAVARAWERHAELGIRVLLAGQPSYPRRLADDPHAPALLFCLGDPAALDAAPTVALVGTRAPTRYGIGVAAQFGADLSAAGVSVVSGLALGIDGAAHEGACGAGAPPDRRRGRWARRPLPAAARTALGAGGVVAGSSCRSHRPGCRPRSGASPCATGCLAALSDVVVVVESRHHGGSRHTVEAAVDRGLPVGAVPGSIRSATSEGTNALLADGAFPVCSTGDILVALSLAGAAVVAPPPSPTRRSGPPRADPGRDRRVYDALSDDPAPLDELTRVTGLPLAELCGGLERLAQAGLARDAGGWWERVEALA